MAANGNQGGRNFAWKSAAVIVSIVLSGVLFVLLGCWETYANLEYPILPPRLFKKWREYVYLNPYLMYLAKQLYSFSSIIAVTFVGGMLYYSMNM